MRVALISLFCFCCILVAVEARHIRHPLPHDLSLRDISMRLLKGPRRQHMFRVINRWQKSASDKSRFIDKLLLFLDRHTISSPTRHSISRSGLRSIVGAGCKAQCNQTCAPFRQCMVNCNETCSAARSPFLCKQNCLVNECQPNNCNLCMKSCINVIDQCRELHCARQCPRNFASRFIISMPVCISCMKTNCQPVLGKSLIPQSAIEAEPTLLKVRRSSGYGVFRDEDDDGDDDEADGRR
uniref:Uncharacterized protein n=1 Tax=Ciona savignyi TaxID=51511 RepID=H2Z883_CIOSA